MNEFEILLPNDPPTPIRLEDGGVLWLIYKEYDDGTADFVISVSREEIEVLCRYWAERLRSVQAILYGYRQYGRSEKDIEYYAKARLAHFRKFLGEEKVTEIVDEVFKDFDPEPSLDSEVGGDADLNQEGEDEM